MSEPKASEPMSARTGRRDESGFFVVMMALMMTALFGMVAIAIDLSALRQDRRSDRSAADMAATAAVAAANFRPAASGGATQACAAAWSYFLSNRDDSGGTPSPPPCASTFSSACGGSTPARTATGTVGPYTVEITNPVPNGSTLLAAEKGGGDQSQAVNTGLDGQPCQRVGVRIVRARGFNFAQVIGFSDGATDVHAVARQNPLGPGKQAPAFVVLDPVGCSVVKVYGTPDVIVQPTGTQPGIGAVDSNAGSCINGGYAIDIGGAASLRALPAGALAGQIQSYALSGPFSSRAYNPGDVNGGRLAPAPVAVTEPFGRSTVDWAYNCSTANVCPAASGSTGAIDELIAAVGGPGAPTGFGGGWLTWPSGGTNCRNAPASFAAGNWFINCPGGFSGSNTVFQGGNVVFAGEVSGNVTINNANATDGFVYVRTGNVEPSVMTVKRSMVFIASGTMLIGSNDVVNFTSPTAGQFKGMSIWINCSVCPTLQFGGQGQLGILGTLFAPNAKVDLNGGSGLDATGTQFIVRTLDLHGSGQILMKVHEDYSVKQPIPVLKLVR